MNNSIIHDGESCYLCGDTRQLEWHHVFGGPNRRLSERYGLTVRLCHCCHNVSPIGVHYNAAKMLALKQDVQGQAMARYGWTISDFIALFGRNYLN